MIVTDNQSGNAQFVNHDSDEFFGREFHHLGVKIQYKHAAMQEIAKFDTKLLMWMLSVEFTTNAREVVAINSVLRSRVVGMCEAPETMEEINAQAEIEIFINSGD